jgi:hypothetical protein
MAARTLALRRKALIMQWRLYMRKRTKGIRAALIRNAPVCAALVLAAALAGGCAKRSAGEDAQYWLTEVSNPFVGRWGYETGAGTAVAMFSKGGTYEITAAGEGGAQASSGVYLVSGKMALAMRQDFPERGAPQYYGFAVTDNDTIEVSDGARTVTYARQGRIASYTDPDMKPKDGLAGTYWRTSSWANTGRTPNAYDWIAFNDNGTFHRWRYASGKKDYDDEDEYSYLLHDSEFITFTGLLGLNAYAVKEGIIALSDSITLDAPFVPFRTETNRLMKFDPTLSAYTGDSGWPTPTEN